MNANWDTSRSGSSGKYYGSAGKIYRAIVYYDAYGEVVGPDSYMRITVTLRSSAGQVLTTKTSTYTSDYGGSFALTTNAAALTTSSYVYLEITVRVYAYTPIWGSWADSNAYYNGGVGGTPDYRVVLTSFKIQESTFS